MICYKLCPVFANNRPAARRLIARQERLVKGGMAGNAVHKCRAARISPPRPRPHAFTDSEDEEDFNRRYSQADFEEDALNPPLVKG